MPAIYWIILLISAAMLAFQVALTRFFSLAQGSHLAFMAVSLALLGAGASGTYLSLRHSPPARLHRILTGSAALFALSVPAAYVGINYLPFDAYRVAWEQIQLVWLTLYYLALTVPFFFSGVVVGAALIARPEQAGLTYGANLLGSGLGPPLALLALATIGGPGTVFLCGLLGWLAVGIGWQVAGVKDQVLSRKAHSARDDRDEVKGWGQWIAGGGTMAIFLAVACGFVYLMIWPPGFFDVRLTPYKALSQAQLYPESEVVFQEWNAFSRVDVVRSKGIRSAPGLSFSYRGELPPQLGLTVDGDNLVPITQPGESAFTQHLPLALGFELRPGARTLVLEPGGGLAVLTVLQNGARSVTVVQSNPTVFEAVAEHFGDFNQHLYDDPRVTVVIDEPRSFLHRTEQQFDLIILPLTDSFRPVTAGAYTLNEDYRYTVEALAAALDHLASEGVLVIERWLQLPPSESLRVWGTAIEALRSMKGNRQGANDDRGLSTNPGEQLAALRSLQTSLIIAGRSPLSNLDLATIRDFVTRYQFDLIWLPDLEPGEVNRYSIVPEAIYHQTFTDLLTASDPAQFYAAYPYAVAPPTDDHPYFFHFFKWQQTPEILQTLGKTWQPFGGSGYLVLVVLLVLVVILSAILILLPLAWVKDEGGRMKAEIITSSFIPHPSSFHPPLRYLLYFMLLGLGFLFVEIPLLQRFILYLGQPAYAFAIVVAAILVASGVGSSYLSSRLPLRPALLLIVSLTMLYPLLLPYLFNLTLSLPFAGRILVTIIILFPLGVLLGVPFPRGLSLVARTSPALTPWVWAVNGCASVISAVLAAMIALTWSFSVVLWCAAGAYAVAAMVLRE